MSEDQKQPEEKTESNPAPKPKGETYKNVASGPVMVCGNRVHRNGQYTLTADDRKNEKGMKRLARAVELGLVEKV